MLKRLALFAQHAVLVDGSNEPLMRAQLRNLRYRLPLVYLLGLSALALITRERLSEEWDWPIAIGAAAMLVFFLSRMVHWLRYKDEDISLDLVRKRLQSIVNLAGLLGCSFAVWALITLNDSHAAEHRDVGFFVCISFLGALFCLSYLRQAVVMLSLSIGIPFALYCWGLGDELYSVLSLHFVFVMGIIGVVTRGFGTDFSRFIDQQTSLAKAEDDALKQAKIMRDLAFVDSLTELENRRGFFHYLQSNFPKNEQSSLTLGIVDLDGFKPINDIYGHPAGDDLLRKISHRLVEFLGEEVFVARVGGDEFALISLRSQNDDRIIAMGRAICTALQAPFILNQGVQVKLSASIGFARAGVDAHDYETLFERADHALYYAKSHHVGQPVLFEPKHERITRDSAEIAQGLRDCKFEEEMSTVFQPVVHALNGNIASVEALARWHRPDGSEVLPETFIHVAEGMGLMNKLTLVLFAKATSAMFSWPKYCKLNFNLSRYDIADPETLEALVDIVREKKIEPNRITFEFSEHVLHDCPAQTHAALHRLHRAGFFIALADFGGRLSNFKHLHQLPIEYVKLDSALICDLRFSKQSRILVRKIVELAHDLDLRVVAQGISSADHLRVIDGVGCQFYQGYHFARPMSGNELSRALQDEVFPNTNRGVA